MNREESARSCMVQSLSENLRAARKLLGVKRSVMAERMGISHEQFTDIEAGRENLSGIGYISAAAFLDNCFSHGAIDPIMKLSVRKILDIDFEDSGLPEYFTDNLSRLFQDMTFLERWFATFDGSINRLCAENDEKFSDGMLEFVAENYNIFIDETVATDKNFHRFTERIKPFLIENGEDIGLFITRGSMELLDEETATALKESGLVRIFDSDETALEVFSENPGNSFMLITRDEKLVHEILSSPEQEKRKSPVLVAYVTQDASLALHGDDYIPPEETVSDDEHDIKPREEYVQEEDDDMPEEYDVEESETVYSELTSDSYTL